MDGSEGGSDKELRDLQGGEGSLDSIWHAETKGRHCVVSVLDRVSNALQMSRGYTHHHSVDSRVDQGKHPNGRRHEAHAGPHGQHSAGMVVLLERSAALALGQNDGRVKDLVELGEVEPPAPESKAFVPDSAHIRGVGQTVVAHADVGV